MTPKYFVERPCCGLNYFHQVHLLIDYSLNFSSLLSEKDPFALQLSL